MKPFIELDGVAYIHESMIEHTSIVTYKDCLGKEVVQALPAFSVDLKGGWKLYVQGGGVEIKDPSGVVRINTQG